MDMNDVLKPNMPVPAQTAETPDVATDGEAFVRFLLSMPKSGLPEGLPVMPRQNWHTSNQFGG
jgi:hypothetical protein